MSELKKKKKKRSWRSSYVVIIGLFVVLALLVNGTWKLYLKERSSSADLAEASTEVKALTIRQQSLQETTDKLQTESGVEEEIRNKFDVSKDGEQTLMIVSDGSTTSESEKATSTPSFFQRLKALF